MSLMTLLVGLRTHLERAEWFESFMHMKKLRTADDVFY